MKRISTLAIVITIILICFLLNCHIIHTAGGIKIIAKDHMHLRDTYVDVREWGASKYMTCTSRVRNYLIVENIYPEWISELHNKPTRYAAKVKDFIEPVEQKLYKWLLSEEGQ